MPYPTFTVEDFCKDSYFIRWVVSPTDEADRFWQAFIDEYPHKRNDILSAIDFVKSIHFYEIEPDELDLARLKQRIWADIEPESQLETGRVIPWYRRPAWAAAAVVMLASSIGIGWWTYRSETAPTYETGYGKIQEIKLADGSSVTLNANSSLKVGDNLVGSAVREVWLKGEAYFSIAKRNGAKFIVHTAEANVEVLGTEFNVNTRRAETRVVLHEGKVQLTTANQPAVVMKPGDMATVAPQNREIKLKKVQPDVYEAWKESYIVLDGKSLPEIVTILEDNFGVTIKLTDKQLADKKLSGKLRTEVAEDCIENLAIILEADVQKKGDTYLFE
ncbi:FecR family protein [uncultured Fibrella sp.]|uniref:FecR family protein n=1 Tax=uncultured Fibrella sp. TaxID=1284596 RepID=UPI0035CB01B8